MLRMLTVVAAFAALLTSPAYGAVLDFTSGAFDITQGDRSYSQDGFVVSWSFPDNAYAGADGTLEVSPGINPAFFAIRAANGGRFSFNSIDFGILPGMFTADLIATPGTAVTGYASFGYVSTPGVVTQVPLATLSLMTKEMTTYSTSFADVLEVQLAFTAPHRFGSGTSFNMDNIGVHQSVPEPGTWALLILGFGAVGATMRSMSRSRGSVRAG